MEDDLLVKNMRARLTEYRAARAEAERIAARTTDNAALRETLEETARSYRDLAVRIARAWNADGACTNMAEEFFSRLRRAEIGHHHHIAGTYLLRYAQESA